MSLRRGILWFILGFALILYALPVYVMIVNGFKDASSVSLATMWLLPGRASLGGFTEAWAMLSPNLRNSLIMVIPAALLSSIIGALNGYVFRNGVFAALRFYLLCSYLASLSLTRPSCCLWSASSSGSTFTAHFPDWC